MAKDQHGNPIAVQHREGYGSVNGSGSVQSPTPHSGSGGGVSGSGAGSGPPSAPGSVPPLNAELTDDQRREQRARLIKALSRFKPRDANPLQFYNCVRELCIMHNCSIDEGLERAALTWPGLSMAQRELYDSVSSRFPRDL